MGVVLLVDEDRVVYEVAARSLHADGHVVIDAGDPRAIAQMASVPPDIIVTDRLVQRAEDDALLAALTQCGWQCEATPIVYIGGRAYTEPCRLDHPRVAACLAKPFAPHTLRSVVAVLLGQPGPH